MRKTVISLFDYTGAMVEPWAAAGYVCYIFDIQHSITIKEVKKNIYSVGFDVLSSVFKSSILGIDKQYDIKMLFGFPPCTDLAVSGAAHFKKKELANPAYRQEAMRLVYIAEYWGNYLKAPYMIENPVSVISTEWRKPDHIFHPYEYGGYLPKNDRHPLYPEYIAPRDAYTKKTCLWTGRDFRVPEKKPVELPKGYGYSTQHTQLGGKSLRTKNIRSATPRGFAQAVFEANQ